MSGEPCQPRTPEDSFNSAGRRVYGSISQGIDDDDEHDAESGDPYAGLHWVSHADVLRSLKTFQPYSPTRRTSSVPTKPVPIGCQPKIPLAALYVKDALDCSQPRVYRDKPRPLRSHRWRQLLTIPRWMAIGALILLSFIEEPRWCRETDQCFDHYNYPSWQMKLVHWRASQIYEAVCLIVLYADLALWIDVLGRSQFVAWRVRVLHTATLILYTLDLGVSILSSPTIFRLAPYLRILFLVYYSTPLLREVTSLVNSLPRLFRVVFLYFMFTVTFAWFGAVLFPWDSPEGRKYFKTFGDGLWSLAILLTTNNSPDVFVPAVDSDRLYFFYFLAFLIGGLFFFTNLVTAVVYTGYTEGKLNDEKEMMLNREHAVDAAFNCVAVVRDPVTRERVITNEVMHDLYVELSKDYNLRHLASPDVRVLFHLLDTTGSNTITRQEFRRLPGLLHCELSKVDESFIEVHFPTLWNTPWFRAMRRFLTTVPNIPVMTVKIPYVDPLVLLFPQKEYIVHCALKWGPQVQKDPVSFHRDEINVTTSAASSARYSTSDDSIVNIELEFALHPSLKVVAERVKKMASESEFSFKLTAAYIFDENDRTWNPLLSACQLFNTCQIFLVGDDRAPPPPPRYVPYAIPCEEFHPTGINDDCSTMSGSGVGSEGIEPLQETLPVGGMHPEGDEEADSLLRGGKKSGDKKKKKRKKKKKPSCIKFFEHTFLPPTSSYFDLAVDFCLLINGALIVVETWHFLEGGASSLRRYTWQNSVDFFFITFYLLEAIIKIGVLGVNRYFKSRQNCFDFVVMVICCVAALIVLAPNGYDNPKLLKFLVMGRMLRLLRILALSASFAVFIRTLLSALPKATYVALLQFSLMYVFAALGLDIFGGVINRDPTSEYYQELLHHNTSYVVGDNPWVSVLSFNDMSSGFVLLFCVLVMNNFNNYVLGFSVATSDWARLYFEAVWILGVLGGLNLATSLFLDMFREEWERAHAEKRRRDPKDGTYKTREEFFADGYTNTDWLTADKQEIEGVDEIVKEAREGGWVIDTQRLTGEDDEANYILRYRGDNSLIPGADGKPMSADVFVKSQLNRQRPSVLSPSVHSNRSFSHVF